jgi:hypothetical protein
MTNDQGPFISFTTAFGLFVPSSPRSSPSGAHFLRSRSANTSNNRKPMRREYSTARARSQRAILRVVAEHEIELNKPTSCAPSPNVGAICVLCRATHTSAGMAAPAQQQRLARLARHVSPQPTVAAEAHDFGDSVITPEMRKFWDQHGYVRRPAVPTVPLQCRPAVPTVPLPHSWACRHRRRWSCQTPRRRRTSRR